MSFELNLQKVRECAEQLTLAARSDPDMAEKLVCQIESLASRSPEPIFEAYSQRARGHLSHARGGMTEAVGHYQKALELFEQCGEAVERARTASSLVGALGPMGRFEEALRLAHEARQTFLKANLQNRAARLDVNVGNLYHRLNRLEEALVHYERGAALLEDTGDVEAAAGVMINRSVVLMLLYRFDDALEGFVRARKFSERHGLRVLATQSDYNNAYLHFLTGRCAEALKALKSTEASFRELGDEIHVAHCRSTTAEILLGLNLPEHALELATLAEDGFRTSALTIDRCRTLLLIGRCLMRLGHTEEAVSHYSRARRLFGEAGNPIWAAIADLGVASAMTASGRHSEAVSLALQSHDLFRKQRHAPFLATAVTVAARALIEQGDPFNGLRLLKECEEFLGCEWPASVNYDIQYLKGRALELSGRFEEARECFHNAIESLEFLLNHITTDHAALRFLEDKEDVFERLAGLTGDPGQAMELADRARSCALDRFGGLRQRSGEVSQAARQLRETLQADYLRLFESNRADPDALFTKIRQTEQKLMHELLEVQLKGEFSSPTQSERFTASIAADEVMLEYFVAGDSVSVFVATDGGVERVELPVSASELQQEVHLTRYGLWSSGDARREFALEHHLRRLHDVLIAPIEGSLRRRVIFVPHRFLNGLPLHILRGPHGYLLDQYVTSYAPSASAYCRASRRETASVGECLIVGTDCTDLPGASREIRMLAGNLPACKVAINANIRELRTALERASIVHIASHAIFRPDAPAWSLVSLGSDALTPADLVELNLNAELVTLSACSTGRMNSSRNEAPSFVRAFSLLGVPSLVASLWEVQDDASTSLMSHFYEGFRKSPDIAENLRQAMLAVRDAFPHPWYWGGFVLMGKQRLGRSWSLFGGVRRSQSTNATRAVSGKGVC